jgi:hypothetical protein
MQGVITIPNNHPIYVSRTKEIETIKGRVGLKKSSAFYFTNQMTYRDLIIILYVSGTKRIKHLKEQLG